MLVAPELLVVQPKFFVLKQPAVRLAALLEVVAGQHVNCTRWGGTLVGADELYVIGRRNAGRWRMATVRAHAVCRGGPATHA